MKILTEDQIHEADRITIKSEPVESIMLMERAAEVLAQAICTKIEQGSDLLFFIGKGNNGGDALAVARMLSRVDFNCSVCVLFPEQELSEECRINLERLPESVNIVAYNDLQDIDSSTVLIDAILGSGVKGEITCFLKEVVEWINSTHCQVISIDLPSGMKTEFGNDPSHIVHADITLTLEFPKLAMLLPEAGGCCGDIEVLPIELDQQYISSVSTDYNYTTEDDIRKLIKTRWKFGHKGNYGHALLICGSKGMAGAAILATSACLRSGCGIVTTHIPDREAIALYASTPSAMISSDDNDCFTTLPEHLEKYSAIGIGCGLGMTDLTQKALEELLTLYKLPMVIDADALNIIALNPRMRKIITENSILTPHPGEFERLVGKWKTEDAKLSKLQTLAMELNSIIVLKGAYTAICATNGQIYFNPTGNSGMAKGGSGDVLTGFITGLLARGYCALDAARVGVWLHGKAGDKAAEYYNSEGMNSSDIVDFLSEAWSEIQ